MSWVVPSSDRSNGKGPDCLACGQTSAKACGAAAAAAAGLMPVTSLPQNYVPWEQGLSYIAASPELRTGPDIQ